MENYKDKLESLTGSWINQEELDKVALEYDATLYDEFADKNTANYEVIFDLGFDVEVDNRGHWTDVRLSKVDGRRGKIDILIR